MCSPPVTPLKCKDIKPVKKQYTSVVGDVTSSFDPPCANVWSCSESVINDHCPIEIESF